MVLGEGFWTRGRLCHIDVGTFTGFHHVPTHQVTTKRDHDNHDKPVNLNYQLQGLTWMRKGLNVILHAVKKFRYEGRTVKS